MGFLGLTAIMTRVSYKAVFYKKTCTVKHFCVIICNWTDGDSESVINTQW